MDRVANPTVDHVPFVRTSAFLVTINTNQRARNMEEFTRVAKPLYEALTTLFGTAEYLKRVLTVLTTFDTFEDDVGSVQSDGAIEFSQRAGIHAHVLVQIVHRTRITMNPHAVQQILLEDMIRGGLKLSNLYVEMRFIPNDTQKALNYVKKQVRGKEANVRGGMVYPDAQTVTVNIDIGQVNLV